MKQGAEECDVESEGCVECRVEHGFTCDEQGCAAVCGDGLTVGEEECDPPDGVTCNSSCRAGSKAEACDMTGYWVARETSFSVDSVLNQVQTASNWLAFRVSQTGTAFTVEASIACGIHVTGSANVDLTDEAVHALVWQNSQGPDGASGGRHGTFEETSDGCALSWDRFYFVRALDASFLPQDFSTKPDLSTLPPIPTEKDPEHSTGTAVPGVTDTDGDGFPGVAYRISGNATGTRNVVQRDWTEYASSPDFQIPKHAIELVAATTFQNQESILHVSHCPLVGCGILLAGAVPSKTGKHRITFRYLGKKLTDPAVAEIFVGEPRVSQEDDLRSCANVRAALPHDGSSE